MRLQVLICPALLLVILFTMTACASGGSRSASTACDGSGEFILNVNSRVPKAVPGNRCAAPGTVMTLNIRPPTFGLNEVSIVAKTLNPDGGGPLNWLTRSNNADADKIIINVPPVSYFQEVCDDYPATGCEFEYAIYAKYRPPVDPKVTVR